MPQLPLAEYLRTLPHGVVFAAVHLTDQADRPVLLHSVYDPDEWQFAGGNLDFGEDPWQCARRETAEETGLDLPEEPGALLTVGFLPAAGELPFKVGLVFDGGRLTENQLSGVRLDPAEHTAWRVQSLADWRGRLNPRRLALVEAVATARETGRAQYLQLGGPARPAG